MLRKAGIKNGTIKPCLNSTGGCPCDNHSGEISKEGPEIVGMRCEQRKMHSGIKRKEG